METSGSASFTLISMAVSLPFSLKVLTSVQGEPPVTLPYGPSIQGSARFERRHIQNGFNNTVDFEVTKEFHIDSIVLYL